MRPILLPLLAFSLALAPPSRAASTAAHSAPSPGHAEAVAALSAMPAPPKNYSVDMKIHADGKDITMTRAMNENGDMRMDIDSGEHGKMTMIELNDEKKTMYMVSPERKEVIKQSQSLMMDKIGKPAPRTAAPDSAKGDEGMLEKVGQEEVNGILSDKYKVTAEGMDGLMWIDPKTGLLQRMQADNGTIDFTNYKIGAVTAETLTPPKDYKLTDMDEMMEKMKGMGGMTGIGGMGGMGKNMMGGMAGGMLGGMGGNLGGAAGGALGGMVGGPLGRMAGQFLGQKIGSALGHKAGAAAASKL